jgi:hypothetical protein
MGRRGTDVAGADRWERARMRGTGSELFVRKWQRARPSRPGVNGSRNTHSHCHTDECQGADGWPSGTGENGRRHYASVCGNRRGARGYRHGGINKTPTHFVYAKIFIWISSLSHHAYRALQRTVVWELGSTAFGGGGCV